MSRDRIMVTTANIRWLRLAFDDAYVKSMRVGDVWPVYDRAHLAMCIRYWRGRVRKHPGDRITLRVANG